jgi:hypothetical protein
LSRFSWAVDGYGSIHYLCRYCELVFGAVDADTIKHECDTSRPKYHNRDKFLIVGAVVDYDNRVKMTASKQAKKAGLKSLTQVRDLLGTNKSGNPMVSCQTLNNWHNNKPELFEVVLLGCVSKLERDL